MAAKEDDLYGDLDDAVAKPLPSGPKRATPRPSVAAHQNNGDASVPPPEMARVQQQIQSLRAENEDLEKNIGILYRTAKSELERKDRTIDELQNELDSLRR